MWCWSELKDGQGTGEEQKEEAEETSQRHPMEVPPLTVSFASL